MVVKWFKARGMLYKLMLYNMRRGLQPRDIQDRDAFRFEPDEAVIAEPAAWLANVNVAFESTTPNSSLQSFSLARCL
jgi:hypothetical protein